MANPVHIGKYALRSNVLVAPMSGVTDLPFRRVLDKFKPGLVVSEMVASERLVAGDAENLAKASGRGVLKPLSIQDGGGRQSLCCRRSGYHRYKYGMSGAEGDRGFVRLGSYA